MKGIQSLFNQFAALLEKAWTGNEPWQFTASLAILFAGFLFLELLSRYANKRVETILKNKGFDQWALYLSGFLPSLRLFFAALLLRVAEAPLHLPQQLVSLLHGLEGFLFALALIFLFFQIVRLMDLFFLSLPSSIRSNISEAPLEHLKSILRIIAVILVAVIFVYMQRSFLPQWWRRLNQRCR